MFQYTGVFITKVLLQSEPFGICKVDNDKVAVTEPNNREIKIISTSHDNKAVVRSLNLDKSRSVMGSKNSKMNLYLCCQWRSLSLACVVSMDGTDMVKKKECMSCNV